MSTIFKTSLLKTSPKKASKKLPRYDNYKMTTQEYFIYISQGVLAAAFIAWLFYRSIIAFFLLLPLIYFYIRRKKKYLAAENQKELSLQFKEAILSVSASLDAGYSIENAFIEASKDLRNLYSATDIIVLEFSFIEGRLSANESLEKILRSFAERSGIEDIIDFSDVFITAKRSGGDLNAIIRKAAYHISDKIDVKREIDTLMSSKKMEQNIMNMVPFLIILYISISSHDFLDVLYNNITGCTIMSLCLILYAAAFFLAEKIMDIEV